MTRERKYQVLHDILINVSCSEPELSLLKQHFKEKIESDRRFDRILNLAGLIKILEKRDVLRPDNINPLKFIAQQLQKNNVIDLINNFDIVNALPPSRQSAPNDRVLPRIDPDPIKKVYNIICCDIGQKWKDFARELKIPEGHIDELEVKHNYRISEATREVITHHKDQCDPRYWKFELCKGLADARRRDLSEAVQKTFAMHSVE